MYRYLKQTKISFFKTKDRKVKTSLVCRLVTVGGGRIKGTGVRG
jgi:hypothetical protein